MGIFDRMFKKVSEVGKDIVGQKTPNPPQSESYDDLSKTADLIHRAYIRHDGKLTNFTRSQIKQYACFMPLDEPYGGLFCICELDFRSLYQYRVNSRICACGISSSGRYAGFQTSTDNTEDSCKFFFLDSITNTLLWKKELENSGEEILSIDIQEEADLVIVTYSNKAVVYNWDGCYVNSVDVNDAPIVNKHNSSCADSMVLTEEPQIIKQPKAEQSLTSRKDFLEYLELTDERYNELLNQAREDADAYVEVHRAEYRQAAMGRSASFADVHENERKAINLGKLKSLAASKMAFEDSNDTYLTLVEIIFLKYLNKKKADLSSVAGYWTHEHHMPYQSVLTKFITGGYIKFADIECKITQSTMDTLKPILKNKGLAVSGKKADLVNRLLENLTSNELEAMFTTDYFLLTDIGNNAIEENHHLIYFHTYKNFFLPFGISLNKFDTVQKQYNFKNNRCLATFLLTKRMEEYLEEQNIGLYRGVLFSLSEIFRIENENNNLTITKQRMKMLLCVYHVDINNELESMQFFAPTAIMAIRDMQENCVITKNLYIEAINHYAPPNFAIDIDVSYEKLMNELNN